MAEAKKLEQEQQERTRKTELKQQVVEKRKEVSAKIGALSNRGRETSSKNKALEESEELDEVEVLEGKPESKGARKSKNVQSAQERIEALEADMKAAKEDLEKALKKDREDLKRKIDNARKVLKEASDKKIEHESVTSVRATNLKQGLEDEYMQRVVALRSQDGLERDSFMKKSKEQEAEAVERETTKYESELEATMTAMHAEIEQKRTEVQKEYEEAQAVHAKLQKLASDKEKMASHKQEPRASGRNSSDKGKAKSPSREAKGERAEREPDSNFFRAKDSKSMQNLGRAQVGGPDFQPASEGSSSQAGRQGTPSKAESEGDDQPTYSPAESPVRSARSGSSPNSPTYSPVPRSRSRSPKIVAPATTTIASGVNAAREPNRWGNSNVKTFLNPVKEGQGDCVCTSERCKWEYHVHPQDFTDASLMLMRVGGNKPGSLQLCTAMALGVHCPFGDACKYIHDPKRVPRYERRYGQVRRYSSAAQNQTNRNNEVARAAQPYRREETARVLQPDRREEERWSAGSYGRKNGRGNVDDPYEDHKKRRK